jgi:hypothetical protein
MKEWFKSLLRGAHMSKPVNLYQGIILFPGLLLQDKDGSRWIVMAENDACHISDEDVFRVSTGRIQHISKLPLPLKVVNGESA